jgi:hypothetical protein
MRCPACGLENADDRFFCTACSRELFPGAGAAVNPPRAKERNARRVTAAKTTAGDAWRGFKDFFLSVWLTLKPIPGRILRLLPRGLLVLAALLPGLGHLLLGERRLAARLFISFICSLFFWLYFIGTFSAGLMLIGALSLIGYSLVEVLRFQPRTRKRGPLLLSQIMLALALVFGLLAAAPAIMSHYWERATLNQNILQTAPPSASAGGKIIFERNDTILFSRQAYRYGNPERGDIVLAELNNEPSLQRLLAIPGDTLAFRNGLLYLNGEELPAEAYPLLPERPVIVEEGRLILRDWERQLGGGEYAVWGVELQHQEWLAAITPMVIRESDIRGKAWLLYSPYYHRRFIKALSDGSGL